MSCRMKSRRAGFTLTELMIITIIIGILATMAVSMFDRLRLDSQVAAAKSEVRNAITAIEQYRAVNGALPATVSDLVDGGFHRKSDNVDYCTFSVQPDDPPWVLMEAAHRGSGTHVQAKYPLTGAQFVQLDVGSDCS
jgi:prepilin-type N-terminal cleavage/methylation domain-containing protein